MEKWIKSDAQTQRSNDKLLADDFNDFFITKVDRINETSNNMNDTFDTPSPDLPLRKIVDF